MLRAQNQSIETSQHNVKELVSEVEERIEALVVTQVSEFKRDVLNRLEVAERSAFESKSSVIMREMGVINEVGRHLNILERNLGSVLDEVDSFFVNIGEVESRKGSLGAYEDCLLMLRRLTGSIAGVHTEVQQQRFLNNQLVEGLRRDFEVNR